MGLLSFLRRLINVDVQIQVEVASGDSIAVSAEVDFSMVVRITENEAPYVWSDFWNCAIPVSDLEYSHTDTSGVAGYRIAGTSRMVWRDQMTFVEVA